MSSRIRPSGDGAELDLKVSAGAAKETLRGWMGERLKLSVRTPPEKGRANRAVERLLESALGLPRGAVSIRTGLTTSAKTAWIRGVSADDLDARIEAALRPDPAGRSRS